MEKKVKIILFILSCQIYFAQNTYELSWGTYLGGCITNIKDVSFDGQQNILVKGKTNYPNSQQSTADPYYNQFITAGSDTFSNGLRNNITAKLSTSGSLNSYSYENNIVDDNVVYREANGNYYKIDTQGTPTTGVWLNTNVEPGNSAYLLSKYDNSNTLQWTTYIPNSNNGYGENIKTDSDGNIYLSGDTLWQSLGDPNTFFPNFTLSYDPVNNTVKPNSYLVKLNPQGQKIWATYFPTYGGVVFDIYNNSVYTVSSKDITNSPQLATAGTFQQTKANSAITKLNASNGQRIWGTYYGLSTESSEIEDIEVSDQGIFIIGGVHNYLENPGSYFTTPESFQTQFGGQLDVFLAKFDETGNRIWGTYYGTADWEEPIAAGLKDFSLNGDKILFTYRQDGSSNFSTPSAFQTAKPGSSYDLAFAMFDTSGNRIFTSYYGGFQNPGSAMSINPVLQCAVPDSTTNSFYLYGVSSSATAFPQTGGWIPSLILPQGTTAGTNSFLAKFSSEVLSTSEFQIKNDLRLFDNPNRGKFSIMGSVLEKENCVLKIHDKNGRLIKTQKLSGGKTQSFNYQSLLITGNYFVSIFDSKGILLKTFKMIVSN